MNTRKLVNFFFKTLFIGGIAGLVTSFFVKTEDYRLVLNPFDFMGIAGFLIFFIGLGLVFAVVSQTGFFAHLFVNRLGLGLFRSYWPMVQVVLIAFVVFDLVYFPYQATEGEVSVLWYILMAGAILGYGWLIAGIKAKETKRRAFIPALFLMVVMTTVEWIPGLQTEGTDYAWLMIIPLLACNTYQLLILHRLHETDDDQGLKKDNSTKQANPKKA